MDVKLSEMEIKVLRDLANGSTAKETALNLKISPFTVQSYSKSLRLKLGVKSIGAAIAIAFRQNIIQ